MDLKNHRQSADHSFRNAGVEYFCGNLGIYSPEKYVYIQFDPSLKCQWFSYYEGRLISSRNEVEIKYVCH